MPAKELNRTLPRIVENESEDPRVRRSAMDALLRINRDLTPKKQ